MARSASENVSRGLVSMMQSDPSAVPLLMRRGAPGVEADPQRASDERIFGKTGVKPVGVGDDHRPVDFGQDGVGAERIIAVGLADLQAMVALEPLAVAVHERHQGDGHVENPRRQGRQAVERGVGRRVEHVVTRQGLQTFFLVGGQRGRHGGQEGRSKFEAPVSGELSSPTKTGKSPMRRSAPPRDTGKKNWLGRRPALPYKGPCRRNRVHRK